MGCTIVSNCSFVKNKITFHDLPEVLDNGLSLSSSTEEIVDFWSLRSRHDLPVVNDSISIFQNCWIIPTKSKYRLLLQWTRSRSGLANMQTYLHPCHPNNTFGFMGHIEQSAKSRKLMLHLVRKLKSPKRHTWMNRWVSAHNVPPIQKRNLGAQWGLSQDNAAHKSHRAHKLSCSVRSVFQRNQGSMARPH